MDAKMWNHGDQVTKDMREGYAEGLQDDWRLITNQLRGPVDRIDEDPVTGEKKYRYYANSLPEAVKRLFRSTVDEDGKVPVMDYKHFATSVYHYGQQVEAYPSLESIHNNLHNFSGAFGMFSSFTKVKADI